MRSFQFGQFFQIEGLAEQTCFAQKPEKKELIGTQLG
jgi:hypothetical protein